MIRVIECDQNSEEWKKAKAGVPSASEFDKIITSTGAASKQADAYMLRLLGEKMTGKIHEGFKSADMARGNELEAEAALAYELQYGVTLSKTGFWVDDAGRWGCSPDRLCGDDGLVEIKCCVPSTHVEYLLSGKVDRGYWPQIQGQLFVTGRRWCDWYVYHPELPTICFRVERDEKYILDMHMALLTFVKTMKEKRAILAQRGYMEAEVIAL
jgi:hypothetical protein